MDSKVTATLIGITLGWLLSQLTELVKKRAEQHKKIKAIQTEISDLNDWLIRMKESVLHTIQLIELKQPLTELPHKLYSFIIKEHFHEVCMHIPREARIGITEIYASINAINQMITELDQYCSDNGSLDQKRYDSIMSLYIQVSHTQRTCKFLKNHPDGSFEKLDLFWRQYSQTAEDEIKMAKNEAKTLGIEALISQYKNR